MAEYKVVNAAQLDSDLASVADAIREKTGGTETLAWPGGFAEAVGQINTVVPPSSLVLDPEEVYRATRPKDWLPMPIPGDDEMYLLGQIRDGGDSYFAATITHGGNCLVEFGTIVDGAFVAQEQMTPVSGTPFRVVMFSANYGDLTSDGYRQYMVRISGGMTGFTGSRLNMGVPPVEIVDIACGIPLSICKVGDYNNTRSGMNRLRYLRFLGNGNPGWINANACAGCGSLLSVTCEGEQTQELGGYGSYVCANCKSLIACSPKLFDRVTTSASNAFLDSGIKSIHLGISPGDVSGMFAYSRLEIYTPDTCGTENATDLSGMFQFCSNLGSVSGLDLSSATSVTNLFYGCYDLANLTFAGETTPGGWTIDLSHASMSHSALVEMLQSLPTAAATATLTVTNNPGASYLNVYEIALANSKNWTITI